MSDRTVPDVPKLQADAAARERAEILEMIEHAMRQLAHGHGADGGLILQHLLEAVRARGSAAGPGER